MVLAVVVPFLNEVKHLGTLLESIAAQELAPDQLVLVDDGSTDGSYDVATAFAASRRNVTVLRRPTHEVDTDRLSAAHELRAFQWAVEWLERDYDVVAKLDADLALPPLTLRTVIDTLEDDPQLGLVGTFLRERGSDGELHRIRIASDHVHGATKFYRRPCWEAIAPLPEILGWDTIDEVTVRLRGWRTLSVAVPGGDPVHLRPRGKHDGALRAYRRWGECAWAFGGMPLHVALMAIRQLGERPRILAGLSYATGWAWAGLRRRPRATPDVRAAIRAEQRQRIVARLPRPAFPFARRLLKFVTQSLSLAMLGTGPAQRARIALLPVILLPTRRRRAHRRLFRLRLEYRGVDLSCVVSEYADLVILRETFLEEAYEIPPDTPSATIVDLGANGGFSTLYFRVRHPDARILACEPDRHAFRKLQENIRGWEAITASNVAAAEEDGRRQFYSSAESWTSSLFSRERWNAPDEVTPVDQRATEVETRTVRSLMSEHGLERIDVLKIDIEGAEWEILPQLAELKSLGAVLGELHWDVGDAPSERDMRALLPGFTVTLNAVHGDRWNMTAVRGDRGSGR